MEIVGGYILLARKIIESGIMDKPPLYFKLWIWMLEQANHKNGYRGLKRGQLFTSIEDMREAMSWHIGYRKVRPSRKEIRSAYEWFSRKSDEGPARGTMIGTTKGTHGILITIHNYDKYQNPKNYERHNEGHDESSTKVTERAQYKQEGKERQERKKERKTKGQEKKPAAEKKMTPPSEQDVIDYFVSKGYRPEAARRAFAFYEAADWHDSRGNPVRSWKQKMIAVWFKEENKLPEHQQVRSVDNAEAIRRMMEEE